MKRLTIESFLEKANIKHGNKYDYSKVEYTNSSTKVCIICPKHGEFWQTPNSHLQGIGCPKCSGKNLSNTEIINKFKKRHGEKYDYSKMEYRGSKEKICIICPEHGEFWQTPNGHLNGNGCPVCGFKKIQKKNALKEDVFLKRANEIHKNFYDYTKVKYVNEKKNVCIICPIHGEFYQSPYVHSRGGMCPKCKNEKLSLDRRTSNEEWIKKATEVHNGYYSYDKCEYTGYYNKVIIKCPKHGYFEQLAYNHIQGKGCPKCRKSKMEIEIGEFLKSKNIEYIEQYKPKFLINGKSRLSLDFFLPSYNVAIECQGAQHFIGKTFYSQNIEKIINRDKLKKQLSESNGIKIYYYSNVQNIVSNEKIFSDKIELLKEIQK